MRCALPGSGLPISQIVADLGVLEAEGAGGETTVRQEENQLTLDAYIKRAR